MAPIGPTQVQCKTHGARTAAVVCGHLVNSSAIGAGFVENSAGAENLQAWCSTCESLFVGEGEMTEAFMAFNSFCIVCDTCYSELKLKHSPEIAP